uniref:Small ribosomal subunit protein uS7 domain-containing protein n=1 Tax=Solanum lycopersicum TaxID=4081 RepID=A0A3Q7IUI8_SOLLC
MKFRNIKTIAECLADEFINAAKGSSNSYAIKKKNEIERMNINQNLPKIEMNEDPKEDPKVNPKKDHEEYPEKEPTEDSRELTEKMEKDSEEDSDHDPYNPRDGGIS